MHDSSSSESLVSGSSGHNEDFSLDRAYEDFTNKLQNMDIPQGVSKIKNYSLIKLLGKGSFGTVVLVKSKHTDTKCALKVICCVLNERVKIIIMSWLAG